MKYLGGKTRIGKKLAAELCRLASANKVDAYVEPFCGSLGVMKHMTEKGYRSYLANDKHADLIEMWKAVKDGELYLPDSVDEADYKVYKDLALSPIASVPIAEKAAIGFGLSYGGKWFGGYARDPSGKRDFMGELKRSFDKDRPKIQAVSFTSTDYADLQLSNSLVYCDPPYANTHGYSTGKFDQERFWEWAERMAHDNVVAVSSEVAPEGWETVWACEKHRTLQKASRRQAVEKLFVCQQK